MNRRATRRVQLGNVAIGNGAPVSVQTMAKCDGRDTAALLAQITTAAEAGCDILRVAVPDPATAVALADVVKKSPLPLVADIHFDYRLALAALKSGVAGLRINPGNIGGRDAIRAVVAEAKPCRAPIRIGVNGGSLEKDLLEKHGGATAEALVESAMRHVALLEAEDFHDIKISVKASDIERTIAAYRLLAGQTDCPLHLGLTEAGTFLAGTMRSTFALGTLLAEGIGDTLRVSLTDTPGREVRVGVELLRMLGLRAPGASVTSCPTCGRTQVDVRRVAEEIESRLETFYRENPGAPRPRIAVMGCLVNGPGEARGADIALVGGNGRFALCVKGETVASFPESEAVARVVDGVVNGARAFSP
ncbi:MAG: flavodoxin-dependent (E)-4-hydroxy-3-methylbut-2-enyl-diphosphate synthase [Kiritimatiellaeota bacterium]|nr:flavodoxin-dependent (E)-4-hydroxy-3-methylbut-2-enyl-diphosphate synthase [Kiritimatiellota bacterium]